THFLAQKNGSASQSRNGSVELSLSADHGLQTQHLLRQSPALIQSKKQSVQGPPAISSAGWRIPHAFAAWQSDAKQLSSMRSSQQQPLPVKDPYHRLRKHEG